MARNFTIPCRPQTAAKCNGVVLGCGGFSARSPFVEGFLGSHIQTQIARCGALGSNNCFIASSAYFDTSLNRAWSTQCCAAYSARGYFLRPSLEMVISRCSRILRQACAMRVWAGVAETK